MSLAVGSCVGPYEVLSATREAQTLASLNHPSIAHLHGLEESGRVRALIMELGDGEGLSTLIARGPTPIAGALPIAMQIADALEAAHDLGIVYRDVKPADSADRKAFSQGHIHASGNITNDCPELFSTGVHQSPSGRTPFR